MTQTFAGFTLTSLWPDLHNYIRNWRSVFMIAVCHSCWRLGRRGGFSI